MNDNWRSIVAGSLCILSISVSQAHDFWLEPDIFTPEQGEPVAISLNFGIGFKGDTLPYINDLFTDFSLTKQSGRFPILSVQGNDPAASVIASNGAQLIGYQSTPQFVELDATKFDKYIEEEGIEYIRIIRERRDQSKSPALELFSRHAKVLVQTGTMDENIYKEVLGYTLELIPQENPYKLDVGDTLEFELLYQGKPIDGLQLQALSKANPQNVQKIRTDINGMASVAIDEPGLWLIKVVLILPITRVLQLDENTQSAEWQSFWASYVFKMTDK